MPPRHSTPRSLVEKATAKRAFTFELVSVGLGLLVCLVFLPAYVSAIALGSGIALIGSAYFLWQYYRPRRGTGAQRLGQIVGAMYQAEIGKFILTLLGLVVAYIVLGKIGAPWVLGGYVGAVLLQSVSKVAALASDHDEADKKHD